MNYKFTLHVICSVIHMYAPTCNHERTSNSPLRELFQGSSFYRLQRLTPSATMWPSSLKGGLKIRIIGSQTQHLRENQHINEI